MSSRMTIDPRLVELANSLVWWAGSIEAVASDVFSFCLDLDCFDCTCVCEEGGGV